MSDPIAAQVESLRGQIVERTKAQQQLTLVSAAVAGATLSFASELLSNHPEVMALLCLLYVGILLAVLRQDQEVTILAGHLIDQDAFGAHAEVQARWEEHKFVQMQSGTSALIKSAAQSAGNYGVPALGAAATLVATALSRPNAVAIAVLAFAIAFAVVFAFGAFDVYGRYKRLGTDSQSLLASLPTA